jgi:hypothetical protein
MLFLSTELGLAKKIQVLTFKKNASLCGKEFYDL